LCWAQLRSSAVIPGRAWGSERAGQRALATSYSASRLGVTTRTIERTNVRSWTSYRPRVVGQRLVDPRHHVLPKLSQEMLAEMVGTTRSRANFFMNTFKKLGYIQYNGGLRINDSLLSIVLHD
jgi:hypothetical protein